MAGILLRSVELIFLVINFNESFQDISLRRLNEKPWIKKFFDVYPTSIWMSQFFSPPMDRKCLAMHMSEPCEIQVWQKESISLEDSMKQQIVIKNS